MNNHKIRVLFVIAHNRIKKNNKAPIYCRVTYNKCRKQFATGVFVKPEHWDNIRQKVWPKSMVNSLLNNSLSLISHQINKAFLMLQILPNNFDVDDIYRKYKGEDSKEEITILGAYDLHNSKTEKLIGIDFNQLSWSRYIESRRKVALFITKFYKRKDVRLKDLDLKFI
jgi:integrase/recombinase XerD